MAPVPVTPSIIFVFDNCFPGRKSCVLSAFATGMLKSGFANFCSNNPKRETPALVHFPYFRQDLLVAILFYTKVDLDILKQTHITL